MYGNQAPQFDRQIHAQIQDFERCNPSADFVRACMGKLPNSSSSKNRSGLPLGFVVHPLATTPSEQDVPTLTGAIVRCKSCRTYMNPFVLWENNGREWKCNVCGFSQATPDSYASGLDENGKRLDRDSRPELSRGSVEYIAPGEYMVRPPQPPVFMFLIDVSYGAVATGMLDAVVSGIKETLQNDSLSGGERAQVGIMTFDSSLHFYSLDPNLSQPQMVVVSDLEDLFLPLPEGILVNASESKDVLTNLLDSLPQVFRETKITESCFGSAIQCAHLAMKHIGGQLVVCSSAIPSVGPLSLKSTRENTRVLGTEKEAEILRPADQSYNELATELARAQISVQLFISPQQYVDLASIAPLAKQTGGDLYFYPQFHIQHQGLKLKSELMHTLTRNTSWEAVMRIRVSQGWKINKFFGHLLIRGSDLLMVPTCHCDQSFGVSIDFDENVAPPPVLCLQAALLYTNSDGERRIRVHTFASCTTPNFSDAVSSVDVQAAASLISANALEQCRDLGLAEGRRRLQQQCQQIVGAGKAAKTEALQFLPLYIMGMLKCAAFRQGQDVGFDLRTYLWARLETIDISLLTAYFYPRMLALHNLDDSCGNIEENGFVTLPAMLNLTSESMTQDGVYLLEDGAEIFMWLGRAVAPAFLSSVFGVSAIEQLDTLNAEASLGQRSDPLEVRVLNILGQIRRERKVPFMRLQILRQGEPIEASFFSMLIEDRTLGLQSTYTEFLQRMSC